MDENASETDPTLPKGIGSPSLPNKHPLDYFAFVIACVALIVSVAPGYQTHIHNRKSVLPYVVVNDFGPFLKYKPESQPILKIEIVNNGAGVAKIKSISITSSSTSAVNSSEVLRVVGLTSENPFLRWNYRFPYFLRSGDTIPLFNANEGKLASLSAADRAAVLQDIADRLKTLKIVVKYESVYGDTGEVIWPGNE